MSIRRLSFATCAGIAAISMSAAQADVTPIQDSKVEGDGAINIVLIPGFGCDLTVWDDFLERNSDRYTMHAVTLPGIAGTPAPDASDTEGTPMLDNAIGALVGYIDGAGLDSPIIIGHSLGGTLAMRLAIEHPDKVGKVIAVDGMPAMPLGQEMDVETRRMAVNQEIAPQLRNLNDEQWSMQLAQMFSPMFHDQERAGEVVEMAQKTDRKVAVEYLLDLLKTDIRPQLNQHRAPLLAIAAVDSDQPGAAPEMFRQMWSDMLQGTPSSTIVLFDRTSHFVMDQRPEELDKAVAAFADGQPVRDFTPGE
ncbi:MAG: alpha/beta hydrolase [Phycisphaeraceae bacterium]|nr:MAG: alpha/beta hydrolase [Phycisphaeraceae bacterium]